MTFLEAPFGVRWTTLAMTAAILISVTVAKRRPWLAVLTVLAWVGLYELIFDTTAYLSGDQRQTLSGLAWFAAAVGVAPVFARYLGLRLWLPAASASFAGMVLWLVTGFHYNVRGQVATVQWGPELLNVVTKDGLGLAYLVGALRSGRLSPASAE